MLLYSFRFPKKLRRSLGFIVALFAVVLAGSLITDDVQATVNTAQQLPKMKIKTIDDGTTFLNALGWTVTPIEAETMTVRIPKEFDEIYTKYNEIQKEQGLNLEKHRGKRAIRYTYLVTDYPDGTPNVRINLLVYKNKLIGGDVCSLGLDGFMHTLYLPETTNAPTEANPADASTLPDPTTVANPTTADNPTTVAEVAGTSSTCTCTGCKCGTTQTAA